MKHIVIVSILLVYNFIFCSLSFALTWACDGIFDNVNLTLLMVESGLISNTVKYQKKCDGGFTKVNFKERDGFIEFNVFDKSKSYENFFEKCSIEYRQKCTQYKLNLDINIDEVYGGPNEISSWKQYANGGSDNKGEYRGKYAGRFRTYEKCCGLAKENNRWVIKNLNKGDLVNQGICYSILNASINPLILKSWGIPNRAPSECR